jgi:hypothetical protein
MSAQRSADAGGDRAWSQPGLLRRVEDHRAEKAPRPAPPPPWWRRIGPPSHRWTAEGSFLLFVAAFAVTLGVVAAMALAGHPSASIGTDPVVRPTPVPTLTCLEAPIPYSARPRCG